MRALGIKFFNEGVEFSLLLQDIGARGPCRFLLQGQMHPFMPAVLLGMTGLNASIVIPNRNHRTESFES